MRFSSLLRRLRALEPHSARNTPWPPKEGSFTYHLWTAIGKPEERRSFWSMYGQRAKEVFRTDQDDKN